VKINFVRLRNFRNVAFAEVDLNADSVWICGENAQGKTNLIEAVGMLAALRSFRTSSVEALIAHGQKSAAVLAGVEREGAASEVQIDISETREVLVDGEKTKYSDFIGRFPALAISSDDIKILRGSPEARRRDADMFVSSVDAEYFFALRRYHAALGHRNALLKSASSDEGFYEPFEREMAIAAETVSKRRAQWLEKLGETASEKYAALAEKNGEGAQLRLKVSCEISSVEDFAQTLAKERTSDIERRSTQRGPHRDDLKISIAGKDAKLYSSEGQQRSAALAIKLAQFEIQKTALKTEPVILCDDILGELDPYRSAAFWECLPASAQIIATSTAGAPTSGSRPNWKVVTAKGGNFF